MTNMARIVNGSVIPTLVEYIGMGCWRLRWNIEQVTDAETQAISYNYVEEEFKYEPSFEQIKNTILGWFNSEIDMKILSGFRWKNNLVWLSTENQFNYKADYDLAIQENGANLPTIFKFGSMEEPVYYKFETLEDLKDFYSKSVAYVKQTLQEGWVAKDSFDFAPYMISQ